MIRATSFLRCVKPACAAGESTSLHPGYRKAAELLEESVEVRVSHYIYETESPGPDAHAEQSHFDLLDAYNELARRHRRSRFEHREDVSKVRTFSLHLEL